MKKLLFIFLFCTSQLTNAQDIGTTLVYCDTNDAYLDILPNPDGSFYAVGRDSILTGAINVNKSNGVISKFNADYTLQWRKVVGGSHGDIFEKIYRYKDNKLLVVGYSNSNDGDVPNGYLPAVSAPCVWLTIFDTLGNLLHSNVWGYGSSTDYSGVCFTSDGQIFTTGQTVANQGDFSINNGPFLTFQTYVGLMDSQLNKKWLKVFVDNMDGDTKGGGVMIQNDTLVMPIAIFSNVGEFNYGTPLGSGDLFFFYIDTNQNVVKKLRKGSTGGDGLGAMTVDSNKLYMVYGGTAKNGDFYANEIPSSSTAPDYFSLCKMDPNGTVEWKHLYGAFGANKSTNVTIEGERLEVAKDKIWVAHWADGYDDGWVGPPLGLDTLGGTTNVWILQFNKQGILQRNLRIGDSGMDKPLFIKTSLTGKVLLGVFTDNSSLYPSNPFTCAINTKAPSFKLYELEAYPLSINSLQETNKQVLVYPNPAKDKINIEFDKIPYQVEVYNSEGKLFARSVSRKTRTTLDTENYASGLYYIKLVYKHQIFQSSFIIQ